MQKTITNEQFVGRQQELARLRRFFSENKGGAVLIAGDRGSGKTTLVNKAIEEANEPKGLFGRALKFTRSRQIIVHIPLIIGDIPDGQNPASYYRSMLLRSVTRALEADILNRKYWWLDLPQRWFRSIGYLQSLNRLVPFAKYVSLTKKSGGKLGIGKLPVKGEIDIAAAAELEISDTVLEMNLRNLFATHSRHHQFIVVIDELDKLTVQKTPLSVNVEDIALLLKNLFNETGIFVFFISDEPALGRIEAKIKDEPFCEESTLFRDRLLINHMHPDDFEQMIDKHLAGCSFLERRMHVASLSLLTRLMPSEYVRFSLLHGDRIDDLVNVQKAQLGTYAYSYKTTMQVFLNHVYKKFCGKYGQYYDRVLYKALTEAGDYLLEVKSKYFLWNNYTSLLYKSELFEDEATEKSKKVSRDISPGSILEATELLNLIEQLSSDEKYSVSFAIGNLIGLLERGGWLSLEVDDDRLIEIQRFHGDTFNVENLPENIEAPLASNQKEAALLQRMANFNSVYTVLFGKNLWSDYIVVPFQVSNDDKPTLYGNEEYECSWKVFWNHIEAKFQEQEVNFTSTLSSKINQKLRRPPYTVSTVGPFSISIKSSNSTYSVKVCVYWGQDKPEVGNDKKTFVLYGEEKMLKNNRSPKIKQISISDYTQEDLNKLIDDIVLVAQATLT